MPSPSNSAASASPLYFRDAPDVCMQDKSRSKDLHLGLHGWSDREDRLVWYVF